MHAALEVNLPHYVNAIVTAEEFIEAIAPVRASGPSR